MATKPVAVRLTAGGHSITANMSNEGEVFKLDVLCAEKTSKPGAEKGFREVLGGTDGDRDVRVSFYADRYSERRANASWLRSAYLAMFAVLGYGYIYQPALAIVRRQIAEPEIEHIPRFLAILAENRPWTERRIKSA